MSVVISKASDLLQYVDQIKHDFFEDGMAIGLKTTVTFFAEGGPSSNSVVKLSKPIDDVVHQMNSNLTLALEAAIDEMRSDALTHTYITKGEVTGEIELVLSKELAEQDE